MSWIDKELKRRIAQPVVMPKAAASGSSALPYSSPTEAMQALWEKFEALNQALPEPLRLRADPHRQDGLLFNTPAFRIWLMAPNGAGLGFTGEGVRYVWPVQSRRRSHNFWVRWHVLHGYRVTQRLAWSWSGASVVEAGFSETAVDHIMQCLVQRRRARFRAVRVRRRWWPF